MVLDCLRSLNITIFLNGAFRVGYAVTVAILRYISLDLSLVNTLIEILLCQTRSPTSFVRNGLAYISVFFSCFFVSSDLVDGISKRESRKRLSDFLRLPHK